MYEKFVNEEREMENSMPTVEIPLEIHSQNLKAKQLRKKIKMGWRNSTGSTVDKTNLETNMTQSEEY